jgi:hypothetical protein
MLQLSAKLRSKHKAAAVHPAATHRKEGNDYNPCCIVHNIRRVGTKDDERIKGEAENRGSTVYFILGRRFPR